MKTRILLLIGVLIMLNACSTHQVVEYEATEPTVDLENYFQGPIKAWGFIQDWRGRVTTRFDVDMVGSWEGDTGTLEEDFNYYEGNEGKTTHRVWKIQKLGNNRYRGTAGDIVGEATGETSGSAVRWSYTMDIPVDGKMIRLKLDDWMFMMNDGILINRSYLKKYGITVAELTLFMQKQDH